jgi:hypothetical protein
MDEARREQWEILSCAGPMILSWPWPLSWLTVMRGVLVGTEDHDARVRLPSSLMISNTLWNTTNRSASSINSSRGMLN